MNLSLAAEGTEVLVGTSESKVYRLLPGTELSHVMVEAAHKSSITAVAFGPRRDVFASGSSDSELRLWELADYACSALVRNRDWGTVQSLAWHGLEAIISGVMITPLTSTDVHT
jgi:WD40 repeat protein